MYAACTYFYMRAGAWCLRLFTVRHAVRCTFSRSRLPSLPRVVCGYTARSICMRRAVPLTSYKLAQHSARTRDAICLNAYVRTQHACVRAYAHVLRAQHRIGDSGAAGGQA